MKRLAVATAVALVLATGAAPARAVEPDVLPDPVWWRAAPPPSLASDPLRALAEPASLSLGSEWAPLYSAPDGARFEQSRHSLLARSPAGRWRLGMELAAPDAVVRGGDGPWWIGAEQRTRLEGAAAVAGDFGRLRAAASAGGSDRRPGFSASTVARLAPGARASLVWSRWPARGDAAVRWEDTQVFAAGRWTDQRVAWRLEAAPARGLELAVGQQALDRRALRGAREDWLEPRLAWRASGLSAALTRGGARWSAGLEYGEGREGMRVRRGGSSYAAVSGPVTSLLATTGFEPESRPLAVRLWAGRWTGDARGDLQLWPFDAAGGAFGSRRVAHSNASLAHAGGSIDHVLRGRSGLEGGLALWRVAPRADYESWLAPLFALGREDESAGSATLRSAWLLGLRGAAVADWRGARVRAELVQWVPLRIERSSGAEGGTGDSGAGVSSLAGGGGSTRGGTIVRFSLDSGR